jgi:choline dehydrogenase-like flavoprotein
MTGDVSSAAGLKKRYDVIVIGSGAGGSTLAHRLAQHGLEILVVERGDFLKPLPLGRPNQIGRYLYKVLRNRDEPVSFVGGQTKFYGAALYRFRESDFREVEHECGTSPAWPITYADIEPYYTQAELLYRVHGSAESGCGDPPRREPFPYPPIPHAPLVEEMVERLERTGTRTASIPRGIDYRPGGRCVLCATCDAHYCQIDAKMDAEIAALRPAIATGKVHVLARTDCLRVLTAADGSRAIGVVLVQEAGEEHSVYADSIAVCAGLPGSAVLLRRSRTDRHPDGLGNTTGCLGRYMGAHSVGYIFPFVSWKKLPPMHSKTFAINMHCDGFSDWPYPGGIVQITGQMPFWENASGALRPIARFVAQHSLTFFYMTESLPTRETGVFFEGDRIARRVPPVHNTATFQKLRRLAVQSFRRAGYWVLARKRPPYIWHEVGTARFGADPTTSVVDPNCQVHGIDGLYVVDQSILPSAGVFNTALTIIALALRAGDHIARQSLSTLIRERESSRQLN